MSAFHVISKTAAKNVQPLSVFEEFLDTRIVVVMHME